MQSIYRRLGNGEAQRRDEHHMELHLERALDNNNNITITISFANGNVSILISSLDDEGHSTMVVEVTMKWKRMENRKENGGLHNSRMNWGVPRCTVSFI